MIDRKDLLEEQLLRKNIRCAIRIVRNRRGIQEKYIRQIVRSLLQEVAVSDKTPHESTGIGELETLLKKIIPILKDAYLTLTTDAEQRTSFSNHIMNAVENTLSTANINDGAVSAMSEAIEIDIDDEDDEDDSPPEFIDIEDDEVEEEEEEEEIPEEEEFASGLEGQGFDLTGRNFAFRTYKDIEQQILNAYGMLDNTEDRSIFQEYFLINLKLYFETFEKELSPNVEAPSVDIPAGSEEAAGGDVASEEEFDLGF